MTLNRKTTYSIGDTAKLTGATKKQIRNWEAKGYIPTADRVLSGDRGYRRFTPNQVELISSIKNYLNEGYTLSAAAEKAKTSNLNQRKESTPGDSSK
jgi:DNA-binding transcriptional MerR regulator